MSSSVCEALQATGMSACSTTNLFFFSHSSSLLLSSSSSTSTTTLLSNSVHFLTSSTTHANANATQSRTSQEVFFIDLGIKCIETNIIQDETERLQSQSSTSYYTPLVWKTYSCSLLCLSSLLSTPIHFPLARCEWKYPRKTLQLQIQQEVEIEEIECVDIQRLTIGEMKKKKEEEEEDIVQSNELVSDLKKDVEVIDLSENLVMSKKGVRMIYSEPAVEVSPIPFSSPLNKKSTKGSNTNLVLSSKQSSSSSSSSQETQSFPKNNNNTNNLLSIMSLLSQHPTMISTLLHTPYFLIKGEFPASFNSCGHSSSTEN